MREFTAKNQFFYAPCRYYRHEVCSAEETIKWCGFWWRKVKDTKIPVNCKIVHQLQKWNTKHTADANSVRGETKFSARYSVMPTGMWHTLWLESPDFWKVNLPLYKHSYAFQGKGLHWFSSLGRFLPGGCQKRHARGFLVQCVLVIGWFPNFSTKKKPPGEFV